MPNQTRKERRKLGSTKEDWAHSRMTIRQILFRGPRTDTKTWVHGYYVLHGILLGTIEEEVYPTIVVFNDRSYDVIPGTVGQYTGMSDKKGGKCF